jgi:hypothetical protein
MAGLSVVFGLLLILLGSVGYLAPDSLGQNDPGKTSPTALIPAGIGAVLLISGLIAYAAPNLRKHMMHLAAAVALVGALGGFMPIMRGGMAMEKSSVRSGVVMIVLCGLFVVLCIRSFVLARIARREGLPPGRTAA